MLNHSSICHQLNIDKTKILNLLPSVLKCNFKKKPKITEKCVFKCNLNCGGEIFPGERGFLWGLWQEKRGLGFFWGMCLCVSLGQESSSLDRKCCVILCFIWKFSVWFWQFLFNSEIFWQFLNFSEFLCFRALYTTWLQRQ